MSGFDAISHAMTSIATGGFSNYDASIAHFDNAGIEWEMSVIMLLGSVPFVLYLRVVRGNLRTVYADTQVRWFLAIRSEEHTSELQSLMRISYAVLSLKKTNTQTIKH